MPRGGISSVTDHSRIAASWYSTKYFNGKVLAKVQAGDSITNSELVYLATDGLWYRASCDAAGTSPGLLGIALDSAAVSAQFAVLLEGIVLVFAHLENGTATPGSPLYIANQASGVLGWVTQVAPSSSGEIVRVIGHNLIDFGGGAGVAIRFQPDNTWIQI